VDVGLKKGKYMGKVSIKGVVVGGIADVVTTNILFIPLLAFAAKSIDLAHTPKEQGQAALMSALHTSPGLFPAQILVGVGCSVFGGWLAARLAKRAALLNGALSSWLCLLFGVYGLVSGKVSGSFLLQLADFITAPIAGLVGGYLRHRQVTRA
jgi:hypothetical protein